MQKITFTRENGNVAKTLPGQDHVSGYLAYMTELPAAFANDPVQPCSSLETAAKLGITNDADTSWELKVVHYHLSEIFRLNPGVTLYVGLFEKPDADANYEFAEVKAMQNYTGGALRQLAVWCGHKTLEAGDLTALQGMANALQEYDRPLSIGYAPKVADVTALPKNLAGAGKCNVSVVIGQAGKGLGADLFNDEDNTAKTSVSGIGNWLGITSRAAVHQSIAAVKYFPTGVDTPAFGDGTLLRDLDSAIIESLDNDRYLFFVTYDGLADSYFNDSHTMDAATSDYAMIENVRTMDKAVRGVRRAMLPELGGELYVDDATGQLAPYSVEYLTLVANKPLEDMQKAGELSGLRVEIDPDQNVLSTSEIVLVVKQVGVGVLRSIHCKIGFASSLQ